MSVVLGEGRLGKRLAEYGLTPGALRDDGGQGLGEYALILGFIAVLCVAAVSFAGASIRAHYQNISTNYP